MRTLADDERQHNARPKEKMRKNCEEEEEDDGIECV